MANIYRYMCRADSTSAGQGDFVLNRTKFSSADEAWKKAGEVSLSRQPVVFEERQVVAVSDVCRESRGWAGHSAPYCSCVCCVAAELLEREADAERKADYETLGGISHSQLLALEAFGMVRKVGGVYTPKTSERKAIYELTADGRALLRNCIKSRG